MKKLLTLVLTLASLSIFSCDHLNPKAAESSESSASGGGALPASPSDTAHTLSQPKTPTLNNDTARTFKIDSIKKNP